jgi:hypothetical protein
MSGTQAPGYVWLSVAVLALGSLNLAPGSRAAPPRPAPRSAEPWLTRCELLDRLERGERPAAGSPAWCSPAPAPAAPEPIEVTCPPSSGVAVLVDHDNETAHAGTWRTLLSELMGLQISCTSDTRNPLEDLPGGCGTIQDPRLGSCRHGTQMFPAGRPGDGSTTPAPEAMRRAGALLTHTPWQVVLLAFDGVVDGDYGRGSPPQAFAQAAGAQVAAGLGLQVVADPRAYRYLYVLSRAEYEEFGRQLARRLAERWSSQAGSGALAVSLSEHAFLDPGRRVLAAVPTFRQVTMPGPHWDNSLPRLYRGAASRSARIEVSDWLTRSTSSGAAFRLSWQSERQAWSKLTPPSLQLASPRPRINRELSPTERSHEPWFTESPAMVSLLDACPAPKDLSGVHDGRDYSTFLAQSVAVAPGRADLLLLRGDPLELQWVQKWSRQFPDHQGKGAAAARNDPLLFERSGEWMTRLRGSSGAPLVSLALVAPGPQSDPCLGALLKRTAAAHLWLSSDSTASKLGEDLPPRCAEEPWKTLVSELRATRPRQFHWGSGSVFRTADARVSIEGFLLAMRETGHALLQRARERGEDGDCVLATFRVIFQPGFNDPAWQR